MVRRQFENLGDELTKALISGDFSLYARIIDLPFRVAPRDADAYVLADLHALKIDFIAYHGVIAAHGVTDIFRQIRRIEELGPSQARITCTTHIQNDAKRLVEPFETRITVIERRDGWKIQEIESSEGHIKWTLGQVGILDDGNFGTRH